MDMTAEAARWYDSPRLGGSPNTGAAGGPSNGGAGGGNVTGSLGNYAAAAAAAASSGMDVADAFYALENSGNRRYYPSHYSPHGKCLVRCIIGVSVLL